MDAVTILQTVLTAVQSGSIAGLDMSEVISAANSSIRGATPSASPATSFSPLDTPGLIFKVLSLSVVRDWMLVFVIGIALEFLRRSLSYYWQKAKNYFWIRVTLDEGDDCGMWLLYWLSKHQVFNTARTLDVSTRTFAFDNSIMSELGTSDDISKGRRISFLPSLDTTYTLWYKHRYIIVTRSQVSDGPWQTRQNLNLSMLTHNHDLLRDLLLEAKKLYYTASKNMISIYVCDSSDYWKLMCTQPKRSMKSIILDPGVIDLVMNDAKEFLTGKKWYTDRGIPHRRGYLLYGAPGSGKTSLIHGVAGELNLEVYILSLTRVGMDDTSLNSTIADLPSACIVLIEDIDAAFHQGIKRDIPDPEKAKAPADGSAPPSSREQADRVCRITLSGLLNALDGIGAQEGRILFATTNDRDALDPALCRPGRLDVHIEFQLASRHQCRELFRRFYLPSSAYLDDAGLGADAAAAETQKDEKDSADCGGAPELSLDEVGKLADAFAAAIPERALSMATLQGYLMTYKTRPHEAVEQAPAWVEKKLRDKSVIAREGENGPKAPEAAKETARSEATEVSSDSVEAESDEDEDATASISP